jgi:putative transposase
MSRLTYPTDITDSQWKVLAPLVPSEKRRGRPRLVDLREVLNAIFYINRSGCSWRMLPHDFPNWATV